MKKIFKIMLQDLFFNKMCYSLIKKYYPTLKTKLYKYYPNTDSTLVLIIDDYLYNLN